MIDKILGLFGTLIKTIVSIVQFFKGVKDETKK